MTQGDGECGDPEVDGGVRWEAIARRAAARELGWRRALALGPHRSSSGQATAKLRISVSNLIACPQAATVAPAAAENRARRGLQRRHTTAAVHVCNDFAEQASQHSTAPLGASPGATASAATTSGRLECACARALVGSREPCGTESCSRGDGHGRGDDVGGNAKRLQRRWAVAAARQPASRPRRGWAAPARVRPSSTGKAAGDANHRC